MAGSPASDMLARYSKLIEHGDPLARHIDEFVHYSLERIDMLDRFSRLIEHREPLARQVDELVQKALANRDNEVGSLAAVTSDDGCPLEDTDASADLRTAAGEASGQPDVQKETVPAVRSGEDSPVDQLDDSEDKATAVGEAVALPNIESSVKHRGGDSVEHIQSSENSDTVVDDGTAISAPRADAANPTNVVETAADEAIANSSSGVSSAHASISAPLQPDKTRATLDAVSAAVSSHGLAGYIDPRIRFMRSQTASSKSSSVFCRSCSTCTDSSSAESEAVSSFIAGPHQATTKPSIYSHTAPNAMDARSVVLPSVKDILEYCRKRKSTEEHETVHKSRKPNSSSPILDGSGPHVHTPISSTSGRQTPLHQSEASLKDRRTPVGKSMVADDESASSRAPSLSQSPVDKTMQAPTDAVATGKHGIDVQSLQDIFPALTAAWAGSKLIDISPGTSASTFVLNLQRAAKDAAEKVPLRKNISKTAKAARTDFICVMHATTRVPSAKRLQAGTLRILDGASLSTDDCDFDLLSNDESPAMNDETFRVRVKALYQQYDLHAPRYCDGLWPMVRKMMLAYNFVSMLEGTYAETNGQLINSIIADLFPLPDGSEPDSSQQVSQREAFMCKLAELKTYHEIATICGGPGIFCLFPEKCLTK